MIWLFLQYFLVNQTRYAQDEEKKIEFCHCPAAVKHLCTIIFPLLYVTTTGEQLLDTGYQVHEIT